jgi:hypothetical protein
MYYWIHGEEGRSNLLNHSLGTDGQTSIIRSEVTLIADCCTPLGAGKALPFQAISNMHEGFVRVILQCGKLRIGDIMDWLVSRSWGLKNDQKYKNLSTLISGDDVKLRRISLTLSVHPDIGTSSLSNLSIDLEVALNFGSFGSKPIVFLSTYIRSKSQKFGTLIECIWYRTSHSSNCCDNVH